MESKLIHKSIYRKHKLIQHELSSITPRQAMVLITPESLQTVMTHAVIIWTLHFPLLDAELSHEEHRMSAVASWPPY